jgi:hypothetical protein
VLIALTAVSALALGALARPSVAWRGHRPASALDVLHANDIARVRFGESPAGVIRRLDFLLGHGPRERYHLVAACNVDHVIAWPGLAVFFRQAHFVGYSYRPAYGAHHGPTLATARGLRVGNTLEKARRLYGVFFHASRRHGGSWWVSTPAGRLGGLASGWPGGPKGSVATISAGRVGCPATAP